MEMVKKRELTEKEKAIAANLRRLWNNKKDALNIGSQEQLAHLMGFKTQGGVNQYLNARIPLNIEAGFKFAKILRVLPSDINPDWAEYDISVESESKKVKVIDPEKQEAIDLIQSSDPKVAHAVAMFIKAMKKE